jgi:transcription elongation factor GreA
MAVMREPMTRNGYEKMKAELDRLRSVERIKISQEIEKARSFGDISENAEYHYAKDKQGQIEARIRDYEDRLSRADIIDIGKLSGDRITFGATVELEEIETKERVRYQIVGSLESDPENGKISYESPMAKFLIGKELGDDVMLKTGKGSKTYEILKIEFIE